MAQPGSEPHLTLTPAQAIVLEDVLLRFEETAREDVEEMSDRPPEYLEHFEQLQEKVRAVTDQIRNADRIRSELLEY